MKKRIYLIALLMAVIITDVLSCTIVMVRGKGIAIAGSNEDFVNPITRMWYVPASDQYYARVCFGFNMIVNSTQGGINEHGLFLDGNSLPRQGWKTDDSKANFMGSILNQLLATCANVEDVKEFFRNYNCPALNVARIPVMDKSGASMIVEWYNGKVVFLETEKDYQIATNFVGSKYNGQEKPCERYNKADRFLKQQSSFSINSVRDALNEIHVEGSGSKTLYSFICDLKTGDIYVYNYHDYSRVRKFNFSEEAEKGRHVYSLAGLFPEWNKEYELFIQDGPLDMLERGFRLGRMQTNMFYSILKSNYPDTFNREIGPELLRKFSSRLADKGRTKDAIFFMERNCKEFPDVPSVYFELGKLYEDSESIDMAIVKYNKTLEIDPDHEGARKALSRLGGK